MLQVSTTNGVCASYTNRTSWTEQRCADCTRECEHERSLKLARRGTATMYAPNVKSMH